MNNFRYDKLNALIHLQNQKSHYRRILEAKKNIDFKLDQSMKQSSKLRVQSTHSSGHSFCPNKVEKEKQRQRQDGNLKLINRIMSINEKKGLLQSMEAEAKKKAKQFRRDNRAHKSMKTYNQFHSTRVIDEENNRIMVKLHDVKPVVGSQNQWKAKFKHHQSIEKSLRKFKQNRAYDPESYLRETLSSLHRDSDRVQDKIAYDRLANISKVGRPKSKQQEQAHESRPRELSRRLKKRKGNRSANNCWMHSSSKDINPGIQNRKHNVDSTISQQMNGLHDFQHNSPSQLKLKLQGIAINGEEQDLLNEQPSPDILEEDSCS